ncbi:hypothetical protein M758_UG037200 [Ceratodon purpureus]|nr:hypothetical protein M758_UG037200 [Ceratodon purpureus]
MFLHRSPQEVFRDDQAHQSLGSMGPIEERDVVEEQADDVQVREASGCDVSSSEELSIVSTQPQSGWLNGVLDLNGILCSSTPKWAGQSFVSHDLNIHSKSKPAAPGLFVSGPIVLNSFVGCRRSQP